MVKKIGIYISAFDPIHEGHIAFAEAALDTHKLDKLYFLVEPTPRYKQGVKALSHRVNMAIIGVSDNPKLGTIVPKTKASLDDYIKLLQTRFSDHKISLIIPDSALKRFFHIPNLLSCNFKNINIVVGLNNQSPDDVNLRLKLLSETSGLKFKHSWFKSKSKRVNSSEVKRQLKRGEKPDVIPQSVYDYIVREKLYTPLSNA